MNDRPANARLHAALARGLKLHVANEVRFEILKTFAVTADTGGMVLLFPDHPLENQEGHALTPDAGWQVAARLTQSADALLASPVAGDLHK